MSSQKHSSSILKAILVASAVQMVWLPFLVVESLSRRDSLVEANPPLKSDDHSTDPVIFGLKSLSHATTPHPLMLGDGGNDGSVDSEPITSTAKDSYLPAEKAAAARGSINPAYYSSTTLSNLKPNHVASLRAKSESSRPYRDVHGILRPNTVLGYSPAELLGGSVTLASLKEPAMPALARAERARWSASSDPLEPLPISMRQPMRESLRAVANRTGDQANQPTEPSLKPPLRVNQARVVHVRSESLNTLEEVPLAIQSDGSVDLLKKPANVRVIREIEEWSKTQESPAEGSIAPVLVTFHPSNPQKVPSNVPISNPE